MMLTRGCTLWFTGLPCSGKSTLTKALSAVLRAQGLPVEVLDGDAVRRVLSTELGFSREDRDSNVRRIGYVADLLSRNGVIVLVAVVSPFAAARGEVRAMIRDFVEVYVRCPLVECERRDVKGMYARARAGELPNFTGIDGAYEVPTNAEVTVLSAESSVEQCAQSVVQGLEDLGLVRCDSPKVEAVE